MPSWRPAVPAIGLPPIPLSMAGLVDRVARNADRAGDGISASELFLRRWKWPGRFQQPDHGPGVCDAFSIRPRPGPLVSYQPVSVAGGDDGVFGGECASGAAVETLVESFIHACRCPAIPIYGGALQAAGATGAAGSFSHRGTVVAAHRGGFIDYQRGAWHPDARRAPAEPVRRRLSHHPDGGFLVIAATLPYLNMPIQNWFNQGIEATRSLGRTATARTPPRPPAPVPLPP